MATITGLTAARMIAMENATVVDGDIVVNDLILKTRDGTSINAGNVRGPQGPSGAAHIICTSTTRPALSAGEEGKSIYETDTDLVRVWTGTRWRCQEKIVCTSTTRPTMFTQDEGVRIYETDTDLEYIWSGVAWFPANGYTGSFASASARSTYIPSPTEGMASYLRDVDALEIYAGSAWRKPWNMPWGIIDHKKVTVGQSGINENTPLTGLTSTTAYIGNRHIRITGYLPQASSADIPVWWALAIWKDGTQVQIAMQHVPVANSPVIVFSSLVEVSVAGSHTYALYGLTGAAGYFNADAATSSYLLIEDIGPAGAMT